MTEKRPLTVFVSMVFNHRLFEWFYEEINKIGKDKGLKVFRYENIGSFASETKKKIQEEIDDAFFVVVEASGFSWYVAYELFYAIDRKLCILTNLKEDMPGYVLDRSIKNVLPNLNIFYYSFPLSEKDINAFRVGFEKSFESVMKETYNWSKRINNYYCGDFLKTIPYHIIEPNVNQIIKEKEKKVVNWETQNVCDHLFKKWVVTNKIGKQIAIIAPPGSGKTLLFSRFAKWIIGNKAKQPQHVKDLNPVVIYYPSKLIPNDLPVDNLWDHFLDEISRIEENNRVISHPGLLIPYIKAGFVFFLFDGLDEFGSVRKWEIGKLMGSFEEMAHLGINIILACRKIFWEQQIRTSDKSNYQVFEICKFNQEQAKELLKNAGLDLSVIKLVQDSKWLYNPLLLNFLIKLQQESNNPVEITTRLNLFKEWSKHVENKASQRLEFRQNVLKNFYIDLVFYLLSKRAFYVVLDKKNKEKKEKIFKKISFLEDEKLAALEILVLRSVKKKVKQDGKVKIIEEKRLEFFHESIFEYYSACLLDKEFDKTVRNPHDYPLDHLKKLRLNQLDLDYLYTSIYGFLSEKLNREFISSLISFFNDINKYSKDELEEIKRYLRNLVEYIGMVCKGGEQVINLLLTIVENNNLSFLVRYDAARALERLHPSAPKPYFDYASDWGEKNWDKVRNLAIKNNIRPNVIRGFGRKKPTPGESSPLAIVKNDVNDNIIQRKVSKVLIDTLETLIEESLQDEGNHFLRINCSYALVRWFHRDDTERLKSLTNIAKEKIEIETIENIDKWVMRFHEIAN